MGAPGRINQQQKAHDHEEEKREASESLRVEDGGENNGNTVEHRQSATADKACLPVKYPTCCLMREFVVISMLAIRQRHNFFPVPGNVL